MYVRVCVCLCVCVCVNMYLCITFETIKHVQVTGRNVCITLCDSHTHITHGYSVKHLCNYNLVLT